MSLRPWAITITGSQSSVTRSMSCSIRRNVRPAARSARIVSTSDRMRWMPVEPIGAEADLAAVGRREPADHVEERGLAGAVGSDEARDRAFGDGECASGERFDAAEALGDAGDGQKWRRGRSPLWLGPDARPGCGCS